MDYLVQNTSLTAVADAIRAKTGGSDLLAFPSGMVDAIAGIASGGGGVSPETVTVASACTNVVQVRDLFWSLLGDNEKIVSFRYLGEIGEGTTADQILLFVCFDISYGPNIGLWVRWRNSSWNAQSAMANTYDAKIRSGDKFEKIVIV